MNHVIDLREPNKAPTLDPFEFTLSDTDQAMARAIREGIEHAKDQHNEPGAQRSWW